MISKPLQTSTLATVGGAPYILTATLVQPDFGNAYPRGARAPIIITGEALNGDFVKLMSRRFLLKDAHMGAVAAGSVAHVDLQKGRRMIAALNWTPQEPGTEFLKTALPVVLLILAMMAGMAWAIYRRGRAVATRPGTASGNILTCLEQR